jgi:hypothetical protein
MLPSPWRFEHIDRPKTVQPKEKVGLRPSLRVMWKSELLLSKRERRPEQGVAERGDTS